MAREIIKADIPQIKSLLAKVFGSTEYKNIVRMGGCTNHTYRVTLNEGEFVVRIPGEGTEELIVRSNERISANLACNLGIDARVLFFGEDGSKVSEYIKNAETMSAQTIKNKKRISQVAKVLRTLHSCNVDTGVPFEVFDMARDYEGIIYEKKVKMFDDYKRVKDEVIQIKAIIDRQTAIHKVPCHNDPLCENWIVGNDKMYLIDWEYAGMNDGMWDLADVSIEAGYDHDCDMLLLKEYLQKDPDENIIRHFLASKIYVDFLWTLWAKTRVPYDGQPMEDWAVERYTRLKSFINEFKQN